MAIGRPTSSANATTSSAPVTGSAVPRTRGAPARAAMCRADDLVAEVADGRGRRADPREPGVDDGLGEVGVLGRGSRTRGARRRRPLRRATSRSLSKTRYVSAAVVPPRAKASSAAFTCRASRSGSAYTATEARPASRHARATRMAISPRLAIRTFFIPAPLTRTPGPETGRLASHPTEGGSARSRPPVRRGPRGRSSGRRARPPARGGSAAPARSRSSGPPRSRR